MNLSEIRGQFERHVIANYSRLPLCVVRGSGSRVWDDTGKSYLDLFPGWGVGGLGHCHPRVAEAISRQSKKLIHVANHYYNEEQGQFAELLGELAPGFQSFFCNSGAEANEGALKLARLARQPATRIITMEHSFHGRTFGAISATGQPDYRKGFTPTVPDIVHARLNDLESVKSLLNNSTAAIMLEPVQGEAGVIPATPEFLQSLRDLA
ncbi:MAG: aminotransferase class III-fold pyridoxal phosphate-dependent enzyme, partial [Planctomycetota bacterium]|nr:aminotransferase class III-fold pyridoxal phosphate-dependent enzyme [Planctomycetota bacterium]